jgi:hypothetical protein
MASAQTATLVHEGKTECEIRLAPGSTPAMRHGAEELQRFIKQMSGAEMRIVDGAGGAGPCILIETVPGLAEEELRIRTEGNRLRISGGGKRGALYGCYALLEDVLGCRWYNRRVSRIPTRKTIVLHALDIHQKPAFEYREPYYPEALDRDWAVRNRTNGTFQHLDESVGGHVVYGQFVHTFNSLIPSDEYYDKHPEYFAMVGGKRLKGYYQPCLSNPDVLKITIAKVKGWIAANPGATIFSVSQNDTDLCCKCPACVAVEKEEGAPSGLLLRFVNAVAEQVGKEYPNVLIDTLAYQWSEKPPKLARPRPNVRIRLAPIDACFSHPLDGCEMNKRSLANLKAWAAITNRLYIWHYGTNFANYLQPLPDLDEIRGDVPIFKRYGAVGLFYEGDSSPNGGADMSELKAYLIAKLMWDTTRDGKAIIAEYVAAVYGKGAPYIMQWLDLLHTPARMKGVHAGIFDPTSAPYLTHTLMKEGDRLFDAAEIATDSDPAAHEEVQRARMALDYAQANYAARHLVEKVRRFGVGPVAGSDDASKLFEKIGK